MVASVGIKLRVDQPPSLKTKGCSRGNRFKNHTSNAHDKIGILVPVRKESAVIVRPIWRNADPGVVKLWTRRWIQRKGRPKADQDQHQRHDLGSRTRESQQKQEHVTQSDLRQCVFKCEVGLMRPQ